MFRSDKMLFRPESFVNLPVYDTGFALFIE